MNHITSIREAPKTRRRRRGAAIVSRQCRFEALESRLPLAVSVLTYHNDLARDGLNANETVLTPANVNSSGFGQLFSYTVQGQVFAQPLLVANLAIPGKGTHNVLFVVTENNDVYAFDADSNSGASAGLLWHVNMGLAAAMPNNFFGNRYGPYHDINPQVGITGTPVIDSATGTMYLDAFTNDVAGQNSYSHHIHALDITTGADKMTPILVAASVRGNGVGGNGTTIPFAATQQLQRPALTLAGGILYVAYGGYADTDPYHGWILGFNPANLQLLSVLNTTPNLDNDANRGEGGIWQTGDGPIYADNRLYVETGNGDFNPAVGDYSDSFIAITPDNTTAANPHLTGYGLNVTDYFTPYNEQALADADADLGSGGALALPNQPGAHPHELIGSGKGGIIYVVDRDSMGHHNPASAGNDNNVVQTVNMGHGAFNSPAYFNSAIYYHSVGDVLKKYTLTNGLLSAAPTAQSTITYNGQGATPSVSANGAANGIVWDIEFNATHELLHAYDASTLTQLFNSNQNAARDQLGAGVKFIVPTVANGHVYVGSTGAVAVYGLIVNPTTPPNAPTNLTATAVAASQINLAWVDNSDNEGGFKIERSTDNVNFTQVGTASANFATYSDPNLSPSTLYYYRVRATNIIGDSTYTNTASATTPAVTGAVDVYHFDAGSGTSAVDSVGANNGTLTGATGMLPQWIAPGKIGAADLAFSGNGNNAVGSQSAVTLAHDLSAILGGTSSLDVWIKTTQVGNNTHYLAPAITGVDQAGGNNDINWGTLNATGHIAIYVGDAGGAYSNGVVTNGQWHNIAMTRDAATGVVQIYVDGNLNGTGTFDVGNKTSQFNAIGALTLVQANGITQTSDNYFNGQLDEVRIYNQVLSAIDVKGVALIPATPTLNTATASPGPVVHLAWTSPSNYTQTIEIDRKTGAGGTYSAIATLGGGATVYDDQTVVPGTQYFYVIKAIDLAGPSPASNELVVTPPAPTIVANSVFYNGSSFDGQNGSSNQTDNVAIPSNKQALLPGQTATFQNVTSYSKGINGIIIDVANLDNLPRFEDFAFQVSADGAAWAPVPAPTIINVYPGRGPSGSTQITIIWADNAVQNEWLQVAMLANAHTGLASNDVFYYGNLIGATGASNISIDAVVGAADVASIVAHPHSPFNKAAITDVNDINRDGQVNANDAILARNNSGNTLPLIAPPASGGGAAMASAIDAPAPAKAPSSGIVPGADSAPSAGQPVSLTAATLANPMSPSTPLKTPPAGSLAAIVSQTPARSKFERAAVVAVWNALDDTGHQGAWWGRGHLSSAAIGQPDPSVIKSLDETFGLPATFGRRLYVHL